MRMGSMALSRMRALKDLEPENRSSTPFDRAAVLLDDVV
jgi:hypothetical protein